MWYRNGVCTVCVWVCVYINCVCVYIDGACVYIMGEYVHKMCVCILGACIATTLTIRFDHDSPGNDYIQFDSTMHCDASKFYCTQ